MRVLDIACGPGLVADAVGARGAVATGLDFSAAMIALARDAYPGTRFEEGDAEALPFDDAAFDAVVSNFGIHHVPDPVRALSEARRVVRPGRRVAFTGWAAPGENVAWKIYSTRYRHMAISRRRRRRPPAAACEPQRICWRC